MNTTSTQSESTSQRNYWFALVLIVSLFFLWGVANSLNDILIPQFKKAFSLTDFQSSLVQSAFYFGYFCFSIPAAIFMQRLGYRSAVIIGLFLYATGAVFFYPAAEAEQYHYFLLALFVIASGLAFLETSANPLIVAMGTPERAAFRLNLAQAFNPFGVLTGVFIGSTFIFSGIELNDAQKALMSVEELAAWKQSEVTAVQIPYLVIAAIVIFWALLVMFAKFPAVATRPSGEGVGSLKDFGRLFQHRFFLFGVVAQFFYVGAQVGVWSFMIRYGQEALPGTGEKTLAYYLKGSLVAFTVGRFIATALMHKIDAALVMLIFAICNIVLCAVAVFSVNHVGLLALASTSFFMSLMFPTIFALALNGLGSLTKAGSSFVVMAIIGGAVCAAIIGKISDLSAINYAMCVPLVCFVVIAFFARAGIRK